LGSKQEAGERVRRVSCGLRETPRFRDRWGGVLVSTDLQEDGSRETAEAPPIF
jgi:hypothetical protein